MAQQILDRQIDICYDEDNRCYYLQYFPPDGSGNTKESVPYSSKREAMAAYKTNTIKWQI